MEPPAWHDDAEAPLVDEETLARYLRKELTEQESMRISSLVVRYRAWAEAMCRAAESLPD